MYDVFNKFIVSCFHIISFFAIIGFSVLFFTPLKSYADSKSLSFTEYGSTSDVTYLYTFTSDYDIRVCGYNNTGTDARYFAVSTNYGTQEDCNYELTIFTAVHGGTTTTQTQSGTLRSISNLRSTSFADNTVYYYDLGALFWVHNEDEASSISVPVFLNSSTAFNDYLFNPASVFPDFSDYEYAGYLTVSGFNGYPYGYQLDAGVSWWSYLKYYCFGDLVGFGDRVLIQFIGYYDEIFFNPTLTSTNFGYEFTDDRSISNLVKPDSHFYVVVTPLDTVNKLYGDSIVYDYEIGESFIGKLIRSFSGSGGNYYHSTLNVNGSDKEITNIVSVNTYTTSDRPAQNGYNYYYDYSPESTHTIYQPTFEDSRNFTQQDIDYIINHYINNNTNNINQDVNNEYDFNLDLNEVSTGDIQKMYDDTTDMFGVIANLFALVAGLFGMCFPFLMFDIPGWLILFGGILVAGAGIGIFIKIIKFIRG